MENKEPKPHPACPLCGGTEFVNGIVHSAYIPDPKGKSKGLFSLSDLCNGEIIRATKCRSCGHLVMFAGSQPESPKA